MAAEQAGRIDHETALVDRVFALFGDPRLPADLRGSPSEDVNAIDEAHAELASMSPAAQAALRPYLVRPADPSSYWNQEPPATAGVELAVARGRGPARGPVVAGAPSCTDGWMHTQVSPNIPVMIWSECWASPLDAQASMEEARGYMAALWRPETQLMGIPPGDRNVPDDEYDDTPETGDGLLDIYLLDGFTPTGKVRDLDIGMNYGVTASAPPFDGPAGARTVAAYIVITPELRGLDLESTLAHEFFHVLEYGKNREGLIDCVTTFLSNCTAGKPRDFFWMTEASATWAEDYFVPAARGTTDGPYDRFKVWRKTDLGLSRTEDSNEYASWLWPLFVQQQAGAPAVGRIWEAYRGKHGFRQLQAATSSVVPFDQQFREFGVRGWNQLLNPGRPSWAPLLRCLDRRGVSTGPARGVPGWVPRRR